MRYSVRMAVVAALIAAAVLCAMGTATAQTRIGNFWIEMGGGPTSWNVVSAGGGDGFLAPGGTSPWYSYPQSEAVTDPWGGVEDWPTWWNEWWYDHPFSWERRKLLSISFDYARINPLENGYALVTINWSLPEWSPNPDAFPLFDFNEQQVRVVDRLTPWELIIQDEGIGKFLVQDYWLPVPYNPEWVSVDVRGYNFAITNGVLIHDCVPEPCTLTIFGAGLAGLALRRFRKR